MAWVKWENVLREFKKGGLDVGSLKESNWGLLAKWWWRFSCESESFGLKLLRVFTVKKGVWQGLM